MKKFYMFCASLLASVSMIASAQSTTPSLMWANNINYENADGANITNIGFNIAMATDGNLFVYSDCGTTSESQKVRFGETVIGTGTNYNSTSYNHGMFLTKVNEQTGQVMWNVYTNVGDCSSNQGAVVPTSDGGAYLVAKVRPTINRGTEKINFVDAKGTEHKIDWTLDSDEAKRYYNGLIVKFNADGEFMWYRLIRMNHDPQPNASATYAEYTPEGIYIQTATADNDDNLYIAGRFCTAMTFDNGVTLIPQSVSETWTGDPQATNGDLFIAKFDKDGNYLKSLVQNGKADAAQVFSLFMSGADGNLYIGGYVDGIEGNNITLGGIELKPANTSKDLLVGCIDTDLNVKWAKLYQNSYSGSAINKLTVNAIGDNLWVTSKARINLSDGEGGGIDCSTKTRDGLLIRLNKADGKWLAATTYGTNQAGFNGVFQSTDGNYVYVYGHTLLGNLFMAKYNIADLTLDSQWNLHNKCADIQNFSAITRGNKLYTMARAQKGDVTVYYDGEGTRTLSQTNGFNTVVCAFELPVSTATAIQEVSENQMRVFAEAGTLHIVTDKAANVGVYNMMGAQVALVRAQQGDNTISLPSGIYVAGGTKVIVR